MNERLVRAIVRKFNHAGIDEADLFQEGMVALLKAERTFDPKMGVKFETYASVVVRNRLIDVIRSYKKDLTDEHPNPDPPVPPQDPKALEMRRILREVLAECSEIERAIFNAYYQGYSYKEIGAIFNVNHKKVDNTIQKIKRQVQLKNAN